MKSTVAVLMLAAIAFDTVMYKVHDDKPVSAQTAEQASFSNNQMGADFNDFKSGRQNQDSEDASTIENLQEHASIKLGSSTLDKSGANAHYSSSFGSGKSVSVQFCSG